MVPRDVGLLVGVSVREEATVAAVLVGVLLAFAALEPSARSLHDLEDLLLIASQLLEVTCAARHDVIEHEERLAHALFRCRFGVHRRAQVTDVSPERVFEAHLEGGEEAVSASLGADAIEEREQDPQSLAHELSVEVQAGLEDLLLAPVLVDLFDRGRFSSTCDGLPHHGILHLPTPDTHLEALTPLRLTTDAGRGDLVGALPEVDVTQDHLRGVLDPERDLVVVQEPALLFALFSDLDEELTCVEPRVAVILSVGDS